MTAVPRRLPGRGLAYFALDRSARLAWSGEHPSAPVLAGELMLQGYLAILFDYRLFRTQGKKYRSESNHAYI